jgi:diguanylate cyclase (GGDEF)-like protein
LRGLAAVENGTGNPRAALEILERAQSLQKQTPDARLEAQINLARGISLHQLKQLPASVSALEDALQVFRQAASLYELRNTYAELAAVCAEMGDWRSGYGYLSKAAETAESQFRNQVDERFSTLKVEFDTAAKEKENALLLRENEANQKALGEQARGYKLQALVIVLTFILAGVLLALVVHQRRASMRMRSLAMTDELTGVPNRRAVLAQLEPLLTQAHSTPCAVLIIDIDRFKSINDQHGHAEGDEALKLVAAKLRASVKAPQFVGRMGGEEFIAVLPGADAALGAEVAEYVREQITTIDSLPWLGERRITASIGVTACVAAGESSSSVLQRADSALYEAKRNGRNCVRLTPPPQPAAASTGDSAPDISTGSIEYA